MPRNSEIYAILLISILIVVIIASVFLILQCTSRPIKVGFYYYAWYKEGKGNYHWNSSTEFPKWNVVDTPLLGYYGSQNITVIRQHFEWFKEIGIDFIIISWWGINSYEDNSTKAIFSVAEQENYSIEIAIMVEACNGTTYNFKTMYDHIYNFYAISHQNIYLKLENKPLVCFYNDNYMTGTEAQRDAIYSDNRFTARIVGHNPYVDWWFAIPCSVASRELPPLSNRNGMICVEARYDDQYLGRDTNSTFDENLTEGLYDQQWREAVKLARECKVNLVTIYSWNEYHERSQIEPHTDKNGYNITSILVRTGNYVDWIKNSH